MAKVKLTNKMIKRISLILGREINASKKNIENFNVQIFKNPENKDLIVRNANDDLDFLELMKETFDAEIFGKNG